MMFFPVVYVEDKLEEGRLWEEFFDEGKNLLKATTLSFQ